MAIKKNDFIEIEYTGKVLDEDLVFDTTSEKVAKENNIHNPNSQYGPATICIGQHQLLPGLDKALEGKEIGKEYTIKVNAEDAFGKKSAGLIKMVPMSVFKRSKMNPQVGLQVQINNMFGIVKTISGGRVLVDFNHPLASRDLEYKIKAIKVITDDTEKVKALISLTLNLKKESVKAEVKEGKATITLLKLPEEFKKEFGNKIKEIVPTIKEVVFVEEKSDKKV